MSYEPAETMRKRLPAWVISVLFHAGLVVLLGLTLKLAPKSISGEEVREIAGEVVLKHQSEQGEYFESRETGTPMQAQQASSPVASLDDQAPLEPNLQLPNRAFGAAASTVANGGLGRGLTDGVSQPRGPTGGGAKTSVFGIDSEGYSFVYVFDRSASMASPGQLPLNAAKGELRASLNQLSDIHQFQIIFYNDKPTVFNVTGVAGRLPFANERNKALAARFIDAITADGATNHFHALRMALRLKPDVIYFLTDAEKEDALSEAQLAQISESNRSGTTIHCIKFGHHDAPHAYEYLARLAEQNGGRFTYVNVRALGTP